MAVNLSPIGGVAAQFLDNSGNPLTGGKIYTYAAGTTTPQATYTSASGVTAHSNPIILDAAGRVPSGEIWLTDGLQYKFLIKTSADVQIGSYDNVIGINSNFVNYTSSQELQTATAGQTVFTLTTMAYQPGTNSLSVFVDGVNQYGPGALYAYQETSSTVVTFTSGLHVGADVKFTTSAINAASYGDASQVAFVGFKNQVGNVQDLADADGSNWIGFEPAGAAAVARSAQDKLRDVVSVKDFGAIGDGIANDTAAMQAAHNTGRTVFYPKGTYNFTKITIPSGGIIGEGKLTILRTTDTSTDDIITYTSVDPTGILINTIGGLFTNFTLLASSATQKSAGAGISVVPALYAGSPNEDFLTICAGIHVKNIPIGVSFNLASFFTVRDSYFSFNSIAGIYTAMDNVLFQDNGDNVIIGNYFYTNAATSPSGRGIWYRAGGAKIIGNKINGGMVGVDINPLRPSSIAIVEANSIENQTLNAIRGLMGADFSGGGYSFLQFCNNQIGGYNLTGPAISIDSTSAGDKFLNCTISDNLIYNPENYGARAIEIRQTDRFLVSNNFVDNSAVGYGSLFVDASATSGLVTRNQFIRAAVSNILNSSTTTILDQVVSQAVESRAIGTINAGTSYVTGIATPAVLGDYVSASVEADINGCVVSADVYALNAVRVVIYNPTASPIVIGTVNVRVRVFSQ